MKHSPKLALLAALEQTVNSLIKFDPVTQRNIAQIEDSIIRVEFTAPETQIFIHIINNRIRLLGWWEDEVDASIKGSLSNYLALAKEEDKNLVLMKSKMQVSGDTQLLTRLQHIAAQLDIDWEAAVSDLTGDIAGHLIVSTAKQGFSFLNEIRQSLTHSWGNYWQYETDELLTQANYTEVQSTIQQLRFQADRLEARINRLVQQRETVK